jgi:hypothetical protein
VRYGFRGAAVLMTLVAGIATAAAADPIDASFTVTVNALSGEHQVNSGRIDRLSFAPLPLGELILRHRDDSIRIEGLPPVSFHYNNTGTGAQSTDLSIVNATYRRFFGPAFLGIGQTLYNQSTTYVPVQGQFVYTRANLIEPIFGSEVQYSRVTGLRLEAGAIANVGRERLEFSFAANPKMRGVQYTKIPSYRNFCATPSGQVVRCDPFTDTFADPENGTQVDVSVRAAHRISKRSDIIYGFRYLNYTAHYDNFPGQLADRNVGWAPVLGYRVRF